MSLVPCPVRVADAWARAVDRARPRCTELHRRWLLRSKLIPRPTFGLLLLVLVAALLLSLPGRASASVTTMFGFNEWNDPSNYYLQPQLNMPVRRMLMGWNQVQPTAGTWDWSQSDTVYSALLAEGLKPLIVVQSAPCWANPALSCSTGTLPPDPAHYAAWGQFMAALAARYPAAIGIEIWNEENLTGEWEPYPDPAAYTAVLKTAYQAIKRVNPAMPVVSGGLFVSPTSGPDGVGDTQFLSAMYAAGAKGFLDGIGIHPYPIAGGWDGSPVRVDVPTTEQTLDSIRAVRDAAGASSTPLWITEIGVATQSIPGSAPAASELQQAEDLLMMLTEARADGDVRVALIHRLVDQPLYPGDPAAGYDGYGVFNPDGTPKQAACQLSLLFGGTLDCPGATLLTNAIYAPPAPSPPVCVCQAPAAPGSLPSAGASVAGTPAPPAARGLSAPAEHARAGTRCTKRRRLRGTPVCRRASRGASAGARRRKQTAHRHSKRRHASAVQRRIRPSNSNLHRAADAVLGGLSLTGWLQDTLDSLLAANTAARLETKPVAYSIRGEAGAGGTKG